MEYFAKNATNLRRMKRVGIPIIHVFQVFEIRKEFEIFCTVSLDVTKKVLLFFNTALKNKPNDESFTNRVSIY